MFSFLARVAAGGPQSACSGQFAAGRRAPELLAAAPHRGRSRSGSRGARGTGSWEVRGAAAGRGRHPRGVARGGLHVKRAALGARELRPAWAPPRPRTGRAAPEAAALRARAPPRGGRFKRPGARGWPPAGRERQRRPQTVACPSPPSALCHPRSFTAWRFRSGARGEQW